MTDIKISLSSFKHLSKMGNTIFECAQWVVTTVGPLTVYAEKRGKKKIYENSIPYTRIGYLAIATSEVRGSPGDLLSFMRELIKSVPDDELSDFVTQVMKAFDSLKESGLRSEIEIGLENWMKTEE